MDNASGILLVNSEPKGHGGDHHCRLPRQESQMRGMATRRIQTGMVVLDADRVLRQSSLQCEGKLLHEGLGGSIDNGRKWFFVQGLGQSVHGGKESARSRLGNDGNSQVGAVKGFFADKGIS